MTKEEFEKAYNEIVDKAMMWLDISRREGLLALEEMTDNKKFRQRAIMEYGIRLVIDGVKPSTIERILTNLINQETDDDLKKLKIIEKDAIFVIQEGWNPRLLIMLLNSHVNIGFDRVILEGDFQLKDYSYKREKMGDAIDMSFRKEIIEKVIENFFLPCFLDIRI